MKLYHKRVFLNRGSGMAAMEASVEDESWNNKKDGKRHVSYSGTLTISDCSRQVNLDFYFANKDSAKRAMEKLDLLIKTAQQMKDVIEGEAKKL